MQPKNPKAPPRKPDTAGRPYGHSSSYTPATDSTPAPFVPSADCYSPPASNADTSSDYSGGGGSFDGGGASGDF